MYEMVGFQYLISHFRLEKTGVIREPTYAVTYGVTK